MISEPKLFPTFVSELEDHLTDKDGILRLLWNANSEEDLQLMVKIRKLEYGPQAPKVNNPLDAEGQLELEDFIGEQNEIKKSPSKRAKSTSTVPLKDVASEIAEVCFGEKISGMSDGAYARFIKPSSMASLIKRQRGELYQILMKWTTGEVRDKIRQIGRDSIEETYDSIRELFSRGTYTDQQALKRRLENGVALANVNARNGKEMPRAMTDKDSAIEYFEKLEGLRKRLLQSVPIADREQHPETQWPKMVLYAKNGLAPMYQSVLGQMVTTNRQLTASREGESERESYLDTPADYEALSYEAVKRACISAYTTKYGDGARLSSQVPSRRAQARGHQAYAVTFDARQHETIPDDVNPDGVVAAGCWGCNTDGCGKENPQCPHQGQLHFAPYELKLREQLAGAGLAMQWVLQLRVCSTALQLQCHLQWHFFFFAYKAMVGL